MIRAITRRKRTDEVRELLPEEGGVFIVGCGTCATMCRTGGLEEVAALADALHSAGIQVAGTTILPVACDDMEAAALDAHRETLDSAASVVVLACGFGIQTVGRRVPLPVIPGLDTLFMGKEHAPGSFAEICTQCGDCILGDTGGICPVTSCHKGLVNGPCGGTDNGKCEVDPETDCAWTLIYKKLEEQGRLDRIRKLVPPRDYQIPPQPGALTVPVDETGG